MDYHFYLIPFNEKSSIVVIHNHSKVANCFNFSYFLEKLQIFVKEIDHTYNR